jgi:type I restriction enzyme M protein
VELGDTSIFSIESGGTPKSTEEAYWKGGIHWATLVDLPQGDFISQITKTERTISKGGLANSSAKVLPVNTIIVSTRATIGRVGIARIPLATNQGFKNIVIKDATRAIPEFVAYMIKKLAPDMEAMATGGTFKEISKSTFATLKTPLPPLVVQKEIVAEIEGYQKIIDGARQVVENYQPCISIVRGWQKIRIGELFRTRSGTTPRRDNSAYFEGGRIPWIKTLDLTDGPVRETDEKITELALKETNLEILPKGTVLIAMYGGFNQIGRSGVLEIEAAHNQAMTALLPLDKVEPYFLNAILISSKEYCKSVANSTRKDPNITKSDILNFELPLPDIETQRAIVAQIETEQRLVNANKELIRLFEDKIKAVINRVWGENA